MMMPSFPRADLVVGQARLALGSFQAFFDAMLGFEHAGEFFQGCCQGREGQQVIVLPRAILLPFPKYHQELQHIRWFAFGARLDRLADRLHHHRPFLTVAYLDSLPRILRHAGAPTVHAHEWNFSPAAVPRIRRLRLGQIAHQRVGWYGQQIVFVARSQFLAKTRGTSQFVVARDPRMRQSRTAFIQHFQHQFVPRAKAYFRWHPGLGAAALPLRPFLRQVQPKINQRVIATGHIAQVDSDLTVINLAKPTAPLPLHADRLGSLFGKGRRIEDQHAVIFTQFSSHLVCQLGQHRTMIPFRLADELLQCLSLTVMKIRDRFNVLAIQVGQQTRNILPGIELLFAHTQCSEKRLQKRFQARHQTTRQTVRNLGIFQQLAQPNTKTSLHRLNSFRRIPSAERSLYPNELRRIKIKTQ